MAYAYSQNQAPDSFSSPPTPNGQSGSPVVDRMGSWRAESPTCCTNPPASVMAHRPPPPPRGPGAPGCEKEASLLSRAWFRCPAPSSRVILLWSWGMGEGSVGWAMRGRGRKSRGSPPDAISRSKVVTKRQLRRGEQSLLITGWTVSPKFTSTQTLRM